MIFLFFPGNYLSPSSIYTMSQGHGDKNDDDFQNSLTQCYDKVLHQQQPLAGGLFY